MRYTGPGVPNKPFDSDAGNGPEDLLSGGSAFELFADAGAAVRAAGALAVAVSDVEASVETSASVFIWCWFCSSFGLDISSNYCFVCN